MTDAFIIVLDHNENDENVEATLAAIKQIKGVASVEPHHTDVATVIAKSRLKEELLKVVVRAIGGF